MLTLAKALETFVDESEIGGKIHSLLTAVGILKPTSNPDAPSINDPIWGV